MKNKMKSKFKLAVLLLGMLTAIPMFSATAGAANATNILENHDVFNFYPSTGKVPDIINKIRTILPMQVTVKFDDGSQKLCPVAGEWKHDAAKKCFTNTVPGISGINTVSIRYEENTTNVGQLAVVGWFEGSPVEYEIRQFGTGNVFVVYKAEGSNISVLKHYSLKSGVFSKNDILATFTAPSAAISDSGEYFAVYFNDNLRDGSNDVPIYFARQPEPLTIDHAWGEYKRFPDALTFINCCKACGIRYDQVYDVATGTRYPVPKTLEEVLAQDKAEADTRLERNEQLQQRIKAASEKAASGNSSVAKAKITSLKKKSRNITLKWKKVSGASYYEVYYRIGKSGSFRKLKKVSGTSYVHKNLKKGKTYYYKVRAVKKSGKKKTNGAFSKTKKKKI